MNLTLVGGDGGPHDGSLGGERSLSGSAEGSSAEVPLGDYISGRSKRMLSVIYRGCAWVGGRWRACTRHVRGFVEHIVDYIWNGPSEEEVGSVSGTREEAGSYETHVLEESLQKVSGTAACGYRV